MKSEQFSYRLEDYADGPPITPNELFSQSTALIAEKWRKNAEDEKRHWLINSGDRVADLNHVILECQGALLASPITRTAHRYNEHLRDIITQITKLRDNLDCLSDC